MAADARRRSRPPDKTRRRHSRLSAPRRRSAPRAARAAGRARVPSATGDTAATCMTAVAAPVSSSSGSGPGSLWRCRSVPHAADYYGLCGYPGAAMRPPIKPAASLEHHIEGHRGGEHRGERERITRPMQFGYVVEIHSGHRAHQHRGEQNRSSSRDPLDFLVLRQARLGERTHLLVLLLPDQGGMHGERVLRQGPEASTRSVIRIAWSCTSRRLRCSSTSTAYFSKPPSRDVSVSSSGLVARWNSITSKDSS